MNIGFRWGTSVRKVFVSAVAMTAFLGGIFVPMLASAAITDIAVTSPTGAGPENWSGTHNITWTATGSGDTVDIIWTSDNFTSTHLIASELPASPGVYAWDTTSVPDSIPPFTATYKVRVQSHSNPIIYGTSVSPFKIDNTKPVISSVSIPNVAMKIGDVVTATITVDTDSGDTYTLTSGAIDGFPLGSFSPVTSTSYTAQFTVTEGGTDIAAGSDIPVSNLVIADSASVPNQSLAYSTAISQGSDPIDANRPVLSTVSIASNNANTAWAKVGDTVTVTFVANENLTATPVATIAGNAAVVSAGIDAQHWSAAYTMQVGDSEGVVPFTIDFSDIATNTGVQVTAVTNASSVTFDKTVPTLPVANIVGTTIQAADDTIVLTFSEPAIAADGTWSLNDFTSISGSVTGGITLTNAQFNYSGNALTITLNKATDGMYLQNGEFITVDPVLNAITDRAGNSLADPAVVGTTAVTGDVAAPTVALTYAPNQTVYRDADSVTITATFNESVKSAPKITITTLGDGGVSPVDMTIGANDTIWTYTWNVPSGSDEDGAVTFAITAADLAGNANVAATNASKLIDNTAPTVVSIIFADSALKVGETSLVTVTFSEPVTNFDNTDITVVENGNLSAVSSGDGGTTWTATFTPTNDLEDSSNIVSLDASGITDIAGNAGSGTTSSANYSIDTKRPTVIVSLDNSALKIGDTATVTFTFSEVPTLFTVADVSAPNGNLSGFTATGDPLVYTVVFTPTADVEDATNVVTVGTAWTDVAGNAPAGSTDSGNFTIDTHRPTVVIVVSDNALKAGETSLVTFTFNEAITGFTNADLTIPNGGLTAVSSGDGGITWTATFTPTASIEDATNVITINMTGVADVPGNAGSGTTDSNNYAIDTLLPTLSAVSISSNNANPIYAKTGDTVTVYFTASETINTPSVVIQGFAATTVTDLGTNSWSASRLMTGTDTEGNVTFAIDFTDLATNAGVTDTTVDNASTVFFDRTVPNVDAGTDKEVNALVAQDATTSDSGSGLYTYNWSKESGTGTVVFSNPSGTFPTVNADTNISVSPSVDGTYILRLTVTDKAGNSAYNEMTFIWDTTRPEPLTSSPSNGTTGTSVADGTATVTFDEPISLSNDSRVLLVDDVTSVSKKDGTAYVSGSVLNIDYTGLEYGTKYRINVKPNAVSDIATNSLLSNFIAYFTTQIDTVAPVVNSFTAGTITTSGVTLSVTTDESATCSYATSDSAYGSMTAFDAPNTGTSHAAVITGLSPSTTYNYYVRCADTSTQTNTMTTSSHVSFTTAAVDTTAPVINSVALDKPAYRLTQDADITVTVVTDGTATSLTANGNSATEAPAGTWTATFAHGQIASGSFSFNVVATDASSNSTTQIVFYNVVADDAAPAPVVVITAPIAGATVSGNTTFNFTSDGGATTAAEVSIDGGSYVTATSNANPGTYDLDSTTLADGSHTVRVRDTVSATVGYSNYVTFFVNNAPVDTTAPIVNSLTVDSITATGAVLTVLTNENATCRYANIDEAFGSMTLMGTTGGTTHSHTLSGLTGGTDYAYYVRCSDGTNVMATSAHVEFATTGSDTSAPTVSSHTPATDATGVSISVVPTIRFNEALNPTTLNSSNVQLRTYSGTDIDATITSAEGGKVIVITPDGPLDYDTHYYLAVSAAVTDLAGNSVDTVWDGTNKNSHDFFTGSETATLSVTQIATIRSFAIADGTFANGWQWVFNVTVPSSEASLSMKFSDLISGANSIPAATNIQFYSAQSTNHANSGSPVTVTATDAYTSSTPMAIDTSADLDIDTMGRQIQITVEARVPIGTAGGSYSTSYGIKTN